MLELFETVKKLLINCKSKLQTTMQLLKEVILYILILEGALRHQSENIKEKSFRKCEQYDTTCVQIQNKTRKKLKTKSKTLGMIISGEEKMMGKSKETILLNICVVKLNNNRQIKLAAV